jgi:hypothetical protein
VTGRQQSWRRYGECPGHHRGLRAGHASRGGTRELGRAHGLLGDTSGLGGPTIAVKTPGVARRRPPRTRALRDQGTQSQRRTPRDRGRTGSPARLRDRLLAVFVAPSTAGGGLWPEPGRWGTAVPGTHCRAGDAGHNDIGRDLGERRRAHQPYPCHSRKVRHRHNALPRWCATTCCS